MSLSRSMKSSSRRSSILKLPKQRQDLQNLNDNNLSNENSPANTLKFKRRVSFAEKKHVKEFCNSVEQGTVWDTTYEEHDLSNLKLPGTSNQEESNVHIVHKENIVYFNQENDIQFVSNITTEKDLNVKDNGTKSRDLLLRQTEISVNYNNLNATSVQDIHMEFTEVASHAVYRDVNYIQNNKLVETLQNTSMELTQPVYSSINMLQNFQQEHNIQRLNSQPKLGNLNVTAIDPNASMELTVAVPSIIKPVDNANKENLSIYSEDNRTRRFDNVSMEITTPVGTTLHEPLDNIPIEIIAPVTSVSSVLHSLQQPVTNNEIATCGSVIPVGNKTTIFHDNSMKITSAVRTQTNRDTNCQFDEGNRSTVTEEAGYKYDNEKTKVLSMSMEMTEAMNMHSIAKSQERKEINCKITDASIQNDLRKVRSYLDCYETSTNPDKTSMYDNEAMEFTEAIRISPEKMHNKAPLTADKTNMYNNEAMEFTEVIRTLPKNMDNKTSTNPDKTNMYDNEAMEFTEAIRILPKKMHNKTSLTADKTNMYDNETMEFTEAVRTLPKKMHNKISLTADKTNMYDNEAMEFTEAIRTLPKNMDNKTLLNADKTNMYNNETMEFTEAIRTLPKKMHNKTSLTADKTNMYDNEAMEFTEAIRTLPKNMDNKTLLNADKTNMYNNETMEFTEAIRTLPKKMHNKTSLTADKTNMYDNEAMEFTEAIRTSPKRMGNKPSLTADKINMYDNDTMEFTEAIRTLPKKMHNKASLTADKTNIYDNEAMEFTEAIRTLPKNMDNKTLLNADKTNMYNNETMEFTEAIRTLPKKMHNKTSLTADKTNMYDNEAMEFTEAIRTLPKNMDNKTLLNADKTNMYNNETMEFTEAIRTLPKKMHNKTSLTADKTNMYDNEAMEFTEAIRTLPKNMDNKTLLNADKTNMYNNETMEFTEAIRTLPKKMHNKTSLTADKTNMYDNEAMEFTEAIRTSPKRMGNKTSLNADKTNMYNNEAMEFTEAIITLPKKMHNKTSLTADKTNMYDNETMEFTEAIRTLPKKMHNKASLTADKTNMYDNEAMEFTEAIRTLPKKMHNKTSLTADKTNMYDNEAVEFTEAIRTLPKNMDNKTLLNADKTNMYGNETLKFTEAIRTSPKNNLTNTEQVQSNQWSNDDENNSVNLVSNKTTICQNNSMTITNIVSPSSMKDDFKNVTEDHESNVNNPELGKTFEYPKMSKVITEDVLVVQCHLPRENSVTNSAYVKEPVLLENKDKDSLDSNVVHGNIIKDITNIVVPSPSESNLITDKEMHVADDSLQHLKNIATKTSALTEHENSVSSTPDTVSLESKQQDTDALTSKENNRRKTYVLHSPKFHNPSIAIPEFQSQNIISHPRRTYTIQPLNIDHSCNKGNDKTSDNVNNEIENDSFCYTLVDKTSCTRSSLNNTGNLQNNDDEHLTDEDAMFFNNTLQELHTITPPSFVCLEDSDSLVDADMEVNLNSNSIKNSEATEEENILEDRCNLENICDIHEETSKVDEVAGVQIEQINNDCSEVHLSPRSESHESSEQKDTSIELDPFSSLMNKLKVCAQSDEIIWEVYHENIERNLVVIGFVSSSLLVVIYLKDNFDASGDELIKEIKIHSRLADDADALISLVHRIIMEKLDDQVLADLCKNCEDIFSILDNISKEVKLAMDFMFDVERMRDINLMEITRDSISFISYAKRKDIILRVTVGIKPFHKIESKDISVYCRLGSVREEDVKRLITNIKRDHKFLRRYISDVKDYIYLMEESVNIIKR